MTLSEQVIAIGDAEFVGRITQALILAAIAVMAEEANTVGHSIRTAYANAVLAAPTIAGAAMARGVVTNPSILSTEAIDGDIQFTVNSMVNAFAGVVL